MHRRGGLQSGSRGAHKKMRLWKAKRDRQEPKRTWQEDSNNLDLAEELDKNKTELCERIHVIDLQIRPVVETKMQDIAAV